MDERPTLSYTHRILARPAVTLTERLVLTVPLWAFAGIVFGFVAGILWVAVSGFLPLPEPSAWRVRALLFLVCQAGFPAVLMHTAIKRAKREDAGARYLADVRKRNGRTSAERPQP